MALPLVQSVPADRVSRYEANLWRHMGVLAELPAEYQRLDAETVARRTAAARGALGEDVVLLVHNYQADEIARFADAMGDSFQLSAFAKRTRAKHIVFAGVTFMAETADLVTDGERNVVMPSMEASCPMAGMSEMVQVARAWERLSAWTDVSRVVPVTYMNSYADLKAFTGEKGGLVCTSANSLKAMRWAFERGDKVLFTPDQHLGENTATWLGIPDDAILRWNPWDPQGNGGGLSAADVERARVILWQGFCQVHERFKLEHVRAMRAEHPDVRIIVHPECRREVVQSADAWGSTAVIEKWVAQHPAGSTLAIGTEIHMVKRLAAQHPDKRILQLCGELCLDCNAMRQIDPRYLLWTLEELATGNVVNRIRIDDEDRAWGKVAIERMLAL
jgi:quinolinate synthase